MPHRILVFYGSYRSDRMGIRLADFIVAGLRARGNDAVLIDAKAIGLPMLDRRGATGAGKARWRDPRGPAAALVDANDAIVYPTSPKPATLIVPDKPPQPSAGTDSATSFANETGYPDLIVPAGVTPSGLPVTISFFGPAWSEPKLLAYAYSYEQATHHRVAPSTTPPLPAWNWPPLQCRCRVQPERSQLEMCGFARGSAKDRLGRGLFFAYERSRNVRVRLTEPASDADPIPMHPDAIAFVSPSEMNRRGFIVTALASGFALAVQGNGSQNGTGAARGSASAGAEGSATVGLKEEEQLIITINE
eukprot:gene40213-54379_t